MPILFSLPNELILLVGSHLPLHDIRQFRLVCHHILHILSRNVGDRPLILRNKLKRSSRKFQWQDGTEERPDVLRQARAALIHLYLLKDPAKVSPSDCKFIGQDCRSAFQSLWPKFRKLQYLSLSCTVNGTQKDADEEAPYIYELPSPGDSFHSLTHFECVGFRIDFRIFHFVPVGNLVEVSLCLPQSGLLYNEHRMFSFMASLKDHPLRELTMSADACSLSWLARSLGFLQHLVSLALVWNDGDVVHGAGRKVYDCSSEIESYAFALAKCPRLRNVYLPLCPATPEFAPNARGAVKVGGGSLLECDHLIYNGIAKTSVTGPSVSSVGAQAASLPHLMVYRRHDTPNRIKVVDADVLAMMEAMSECAPALCLVGWLVPVPHYVDEFKTMWCKRETVVGQSQWIYTFDDSWPTSNLDAVFV